VDHQRGVVGGESGGEGRGFAGGVHGVDRTGTLIGDGGKAARFAGGVHGVNGTGPLTGDGGKAASRLLRRSGALRGVSTSLLRRVGIMT
jgi:hypothetical protein